MAVRSCGTCKVEQDRAPPPYSLGALERHNCTVPQGTYTPEIARIKRLLRNFGKIVAHPCTQVRLVALR